MYPQSLQQQSGHSLPHRPQPFGPPSSAFEYNMTAGSAIPSDAHASFAPKSDNSVSRRFFEHSSGQRVFTDAIVVDAIRAEYPELHLSIVPRYNCDLVSWASAGHAGLAAIDKEKDQLRWQTYVPPPTRLGGPQGTLAEQIIFGKFLLEWKGREYIMYIADGRDANYPYAHTDNQFILAPSIEASNRLVAEAGVWANELHDEIWVFDQGYWQKSRELYDSVKKASWDDVILSEDMKKTIISDVNNFYDSRDTFDRLNVPWKRGIIYYGPPGNGKTISIKAMMNMLYKRKDPIPTLYVKTLTSFAGPEYSINQIFRKARITAPCYLVFEDLDSIVSDQVRSFFLNAVDGIQRNDGILMVGSTNHLERLDPGISKRPSRFDRKYFYDNPNEKERFMYMQYWQGKLKGSEVDMPDKVCKAIAKITKDFSFAYLQEAMIASLLLIARDQDNDDLSDAVCLECMDSHSRPSNGNTCDGETRRPFKGLYDWIWTVRRADDEDPGLDKYVLWRVIKKQIRILREEMDSEKVVKK